MPSDSVSSFLDRAKAMRVLPPDQVDELYDLPDIPKENLTAVCEFLHHRGILSDYQAELVRNGRASELTFAGYPVINEIGPCNGGREYRALHPSLRTPIILRRLRKEWIGLGNLDRFVERAQAACPITHAHLTSLLDAGISQDEPFVTSEPHDGGDLQTLVTDIGPMPTVLAADYARQVASALQAAHERGLAHGAVRPDAIFVGPLVPMSKTRPDGKPRMRPGPGALVKLSELGLVLQCDTSAESKPYVAPELREGSEPTNAGDVYSLAATIFFLVTARAPGVSEDPSALSIMRQDMPAEFVALLKEMMAWEAGMRPTIAAVVERLERLCGSAPVAPPVPPALSVSSSLNLANTDPTTNKYETTEPGPLPPVSSESESSDVTLASAESESPSVDVDPHESSDVEPLVPAPGNAWAAVPYHGSTGGEYTPPAYAGWPGGEHYAPSWPGAQQPVPQQPWSPAAGHHDPHMHEEHGPDLHAEAAGTPLTPRAQDARSSKTMLWLIAGGALNLIAVLGWVYLFAQPGCSGDPEPETQPKKTNKQKK